MIPRVAPHIRRRGGEIGQRKLRGRPWRAATCASRKVMSKQTIWGLWTKCAGLFCGILERATTRFTHL